MTQSETLILKRHTRGLDGEVSWPAGVTDEAMKYSGPGATWLVAVRYIPLCDIFSGVADLWEANRM